MGADGHVELYRKQDLIKLVSMKDVRRLYQNVSEVIIGGVFYVSIYWDTERAEREVKYNTETETMNGILEMAYEATWQVWT